MKKILAFTVSLMIGFCLFACSSDNLSKQDASIRTINNSNDDKKSEEQVAKYSSIIKNKLFDDQSQFDHSFEIVFEEYDDFDNDNIIEGVIALKNPSSDSLVAQIVYAKILDDEKIEILDEIDVSSFMNITNCRLISVKDIENRLICINYSQSEQSKVFVLYELNGIQIIPSFTAFLRGEIGEASLLDSDNDGIYDGYKTKSYGLNNYYYNLYQDFEFYKNHYEDSEIYSDFSLGDRIIDSAVDIGDYPENPKDVILEYLYLSEIRSCIRGEEFELFPVKNLDERISRLCEVGYIDDEKYHYDSSILKNTAIDIEPKLDYDINITGNNATATAKIVGDIREEDHVYVSNLNDFKLERDAKTDKWHITSNIIVPYNSKLLEALNNPEDEEPTESPYFDRIIWGGDLDSRGYELEMDGNYMGDIYLHNEVIHEDDSYVVVHTCQIYDIDDEENTNFSQNLPDERKLDWYFVEFFDGDNEYFDFGGLVYIMTKKGFNEFMRTGEVVENYDMQIVACDYDIGDVLKEDQKGWHHYIEIKGEYKDNIYTDKDKIPEIIYHGYSNTNESNYYERFIWKRGLGLIGYESGFGAEKDTINLTYLP